VRVDRSAVVGKACPEASGDSGNPMTADAGGRAVNDCRCMGQRKSIAAHEDRRGWPVPVLVR
jgi:hypothetical protein